MAITSAPLEDTSFKLLIVLSLIDLSSTIAITPKSSSISDILPCFSSPAGKASL